VSRLMKNIPPHSCTMPSRRSMLRTYKLDQMNLRAAAHDVLQERTRVESAFLRARGQASWRAEARGSIGERFGDVSVS